MKIVFFIFLNLSLFATELFTISFSGNDELATKELLGVINPNIGILEAFHTPTIEQSKVEAAKNTLLKHYQNSGFSNTKISTSIHASNKIIFNINEGTPLFISAISIEQTSLDHTELLKSFRFKIGERFNSAKFEDAKRTIYEFIQLHGRYIPKFTMKASINERNFVEILLNIPDEKPQIIRLITLENKTSIPDKMIFSKINIEPNTPYSSTLISKIYTNLYALRAFSYVNVVVDEDLNDGLLLKIIVADPISSRYKLSLGYDSNERQKLKASYQHNNLFGNMAGFESALSISGFRQFLDVSVFTPMTEFPIVLKNSSKFINEQTSFFNTRSAINTSSAQHRINTRFSETMFFSVENVFLNNSTQSNAANGYLLNSVGYQISLQDVDSAILPTDGYSARLGATLYSNLLGSDLNFIQYSASALYMLPISTNKLLFKGSFKKIDVLDNTSVVPMFKLSPIGGSNSNRGTAFQTYFSDEVFDFSTEIHTAVTSDLDFVSFIDITSFHHFTPNINKQDIIESFGCGVRYKTRVGAIKVDVAQAFITPFTSDINVHFGFGYTF